MPNRIIKETICTSDNLDRLSTEAENFFYRLMVVCDDFGIMFAAPSILRSKCYPWKIDKIKDKDIEKWRSELVEAELIYLYEYDSKLYLKFTKWEEHQQVRATKSKYPTPDIEGVKLISNEIKCNQLKSNAPVIDNSNRIRNKIIDEYSQNEKLKTTLEDFIDMRKKIKKPMTDKALELLLKNLDNLGKTDDEKIQILENSIANSWQGIFELKNKPTNKAAPNNKFNNCENRKYDQKSIEEQMLAASRKDSEELNSFK